MVSPFNRLLMPVKRRLQLMVDRAILRIITDTTQRQQLQIQTLADETDSNIERWQNYGHTSVPPVGSEAITLALNGNRSNLVVICAEDKTVRLKDLKPGDSALYHLEGHFFKLTKGKKGELIADTLNISVKQVNITAIDGVDITAPDVSISGNLTIGGNCEAAGRVIGQEGGTFKGIESEAHRHKENGRDNLSDGPQ
ncbi:phage baseplate assembly protein V [Grimontia sp. SpTr1]|uniref:phage baseplate assembly protein V n=1 Tax=Grimontia sp. SpTr1 TaxID=2995319 RepID=UPI00248B4E17|nr:phage baseplate assembly protein V [Grimontia sp. SpTr1]